MLYDYFYNCVEYAYDVSVLVRSELLQFSSFVRYWKKRVMASAVLRSVGSIL